MLVQCMIGGTAQNIELSNVYEDFTVKFNSDGLTINNTLYATANYSFIKYNVVDDLLFMASYAACVPIHIVYPLTLLAVPPADDEPA